jgi:hypothetical protein
MLTGGAGGAGEDRVPRDRRGSRGRKGRRGRRKDRRDRRRDRRDSRRGDHLRPSEFRRGGHLLPKRCRLGASRHGSESEPQRAAASSRRRMAGERTEDMAERYWLVFHLWLCHDVLSPRIRRTLSAAPAPRERVTRATATASWRGHSRCADMVRCASWW